MKKISIFLMLMAFFAPLAANAQTEIEIGTGGTTTSNLPVYALYENSYSQQLFTAEEIGMAGSITSISFFPTTASSYDRVVDIYMLNVSRTAFASNTEWEAVTASDLVVANATIPTSITNDWVTIELSTPFDYDGTSTLLVAVNDHTGSWNGKSFSADANMTGKGIYIYQDGTAYDPTTITSGGYVLNVRNNIKLEITAGSGPTCDRPATLVVSDVTSYGATCTWESNVGNYTFEYKNAADSDWTVVPNLTATTYTLSSLEPMTTYNTRVKAICDAGLESGYRTANFTTKEVCPDGKICIGEGTATNNYLPANNYYKYSLTQQIYTADEIGEAGAILSIDFFKASTTAMAVDLDIYMVSTDKDEFSGVADFVPVTASDLVYSGTVTFADNDWTTIELDNPFVYDGRSNVAIMVDNNTGDYEANTPFYVFNSVKNQALYVYADGTNYDPFAPAFSYRTAQKNRIRLAIGEPPACPKPTNLTVEPSWTSANLSWQGTSNSYEVQYRTAESSQPAEGSFVDDFEDGIDQWTLLVNGEGDGFTRINPSTYFSTPYPAHSGDYVVVCRSYNGNALSADNWMISPQLTIPSTMSFWAMGDPGYPETYSVCVSTTGTETSNFTVVQTYTENPGEWTQIMVDLSSYAGQTGYVAFHHEAEDADFLFIDDVVIGVEIVPAGAWIERSTTETSIELTGLTLDTEYEYQVKGFCEDSEESEWTNILTFTTLNDKDKHFVTAGAWNVAGNWMPEGVPTDNCFVTIKAAATIPSGCDAVAKEITIDGGSITIQDGGQLHSGNDVTATVEKNINGYTGTKDNYYLIASPLYLTSTTISNVQNLQSGTFDFYTFDGTQELEWINQNPAYNTSAITTLGLGKGYLYANAANLTTLSFTGTVAAQLSNFTYNGSTLTYDATADPAEGNFTNWNLVGNFLPHNGYPYVGTVSGGYVVYADEQNFYTMGDGELIVAVDEYVKPAEGIFVEATGASQYVFWSSVSHTAKSASMSMNVSYQGTLVDRALLRFGEGKGLGKFQMNPNHTKIYMPVEGKDYAVVYTEAQGEMPVSFKAEENGTYTLSFNTKDVELGYLHLIDNMTGIETDLLANPSYSFEASTTDYANRFKLMFSTGDNNSEDFAFFSNGSFVINNEGNATVQVMDVNGRILSSENINGCANVNVKAAAGVYMIRLVNGSNVKVQKVVVK